MKIIAHRGASGYAPENTLKAFELAVKMGARDFEFDIHRTKDGILVVHHDYDLKRTAAKEAKIAELEEVLDIIEPAARWLNFEIKNDGNVYPGVEEQLLAFLRSKPGLFEKAVVSSFDQGTVRRFRELSPELRLAYLSHGLSAMLLTPALKKAKAIGAVNFHINLRLAFKLNVAKIKKAGFRVCVYTVNNSKDALRMKEIGADGIFSNYPDIMTRCVDA